MRCIRVLTEGILSEPTLQVLGSSSIGAKSTDEETIALKKMHDFSAADGFVKVTDDLSDMIKLLASEPSAGLFYIQQHTHNSTANLLSLETNVIGKSHETPIHTEDLEDSVTMLGSMKECGFPIVDEMIKEIKKSLSIISTKKPKKGLITHSPGVGFLGHAGSWSPATWGPNSVYMRRDGGGRSGYLSDIFRSANNFKGDRVEKGKEVSQSEGEEISTDIDQSVATAPESCLRITEMVKGEDFRVSRELETNQDLLKFCLNKD